MVSRNSELRLIDRKEVEYLYGVSKRFLELAAVKGIGPAYVKIGRSVRYRRDDIEAWILEQRIPCDQRGEKSGGGFS